MGRKPHTSVRPDTPRRTVPFQRDGFERLVRFGGIECVDGSERGGDADAYVDGLGASDGGRGGLGWLVSVCAGLLQEGHVGIVGRHVAGDGVRKRGTRGR